VTTVIRSIARVAVGVAIQWGAGTAIAQTPPAEAAVANGSPLPQACFKAVTALRGQLTQAPADRQPRLGQLIAEQQAACEALQGRQLRMSDVEVVVAEAQIELSLARLTTAVNDSSGGRGVSLAGAAQAVREALGSTQATGADPRKVVLTLAADAPSAALDGFVLPLSVFSGAALLPPARLQDLLTRLRFPNPVRVGQPSERRLPANGQFLVWIAQAQNPGQMAERLRDSSQRAQLRTRTIDADSVSPIELRFSPDEAARDISGAK
jgi:hypothetical protein